MLAAAGYRVIVPHLRGYGTTRFRSDEAMRNGQQAALAIDAIALLDALRSGRRSSPGSIGAPHSRNHRGALAGTVHGAGVGKWLPDRQPAGRQGPLPPKAELHGGTSTTSRPSADGPATTGTGTSSPSSSGGPRRRNGSSTMRHSSERGVLRQPRSRRHRHPQLSLAARPRQRRGRIRRAREHGWPTAQPSRCPRSRWRAMPTVHLIPTRRYERSSPGAYEHRAIEWQRRARPAAGSAARHSPRR